MYDREFTEDEVPKLIDKWREEHKIKVSENRRLGREKAKISKEKNNKIISKFDENLAEVFSSWNSVSDFIGANFELAYWTTWISRWAKSLELKARSRLTKKDYHKESEELYELKNKAMELFCKSSVAKLSFYESKNPHRVDANFCWKHYEDFDTWRYLVGGAYASEYYFAHQKEIDNCKSCHVSVDLYYYSLFYVQIEHEGIEEKFSFHTPFPLGEEIFPDRDVLPKVHHKEQEGFFRFGREVYDDEVLTHRKTKVVKEFKKAFARLKTLLENEKELKD